MQPLFRSGLVAFQMNLAVYVAFCTLMQNPGHGSTGITNNLIWLLFI